MAFVAFYFEGFLGGVYGSVVMFPNLGNVGRFLGVTWVIGYCWFSCWKSGIQCSILLVH